MNIRIAEKNDLPAIQTLLESWQLPIEGIDKHLNHFFVLEEGKKILGSIGLEIYGNKALLRSLAVAPEVRGKGYGHRLCQAVLDMAVSIELEEIVLLTETARDFFERHGFRVIKRESVDQRIRNSVEFRTGCPASAVCMRLRLK